VSKYDPLGEFLKTQRTEAIAMTFAEIERVVGGKLPNSAYEHRPWWSNNPGNSVMTKVWLAAGFLSEQVDMEGRKLVFRRSGEVPSSGGLAEEAREFRHIEMDEAKKTPRRSPLFGALKDTFWIDPNWDLAKPSLSDEELAEWDASLDRKAGRMFGKKP